MKFPSDQLGSALGRINRLLLPEIDLLPKPVEAVLYWCSVCLLIATSLVCSAYPFSDYPEAIASFSGSEVRNSLIFPPVVLASLFILPGLCLFALSQVLSTSRRPWKLVIGLTLSHYVVGSLAIVLIFAGFLYWSKNTRAA